MQQLCSAAARPDAVLTDQNKCGETSLPLRDTFTALKLRHTEWRSTSQTFIVSIHQSQCIKGHFLFRKFHRYAFISSLPPRVCPASGRRWCRGCCCANTSLLCFNWFINSVLFLRECFLLSDGQMATWGPPPPANMSPSRAGAALILYSGGI